MSTPKQLEIGNHCVVHRPEYSFTGTVIDLHLDRVRVAGLGSIIGSKYDEWFPISSKRLTVEPFRTQPNE